MKVSVDGLEGEAGESADAAVGRVPVEVDQALVLEQAEVALGQLQRRGFVTGLGCGELEDREFAGWAGGRGVNEPRLEMVLGVLGQLEMAGIALLVAGKAYGEGGSGLGGRGDVDRAAVRRDDLAGD